MGNINTHAMFVTADDFFNYSGRDLSVLLQDNENYSQRPDLFLMQVEDDLLARIDKISFRNFKWTDISGYQRDCLEKAIIKQALYVLRNGEVLSDSGYDPEKGKIISRADIENIAIAANTVDKLSACGLLNHVMDNRRRYTRLR